MMTFNPFFLCVAVQEHLLRTSDDFVWQVDVMSHGRFTIDVEFLDLRIATNNASTYLPLALFCFDICRTFFFLASAS
jgi:hypothetical protein